MLSHCSSALSGVRVIFRFVFVLCFVCQMLLVSLNSPFVIAHSGVFIICLLLIYILRFLYTIKLFLPILFKLYLSFFSQTLKIWPCQHLVKHVWWLHQILEESLIGSYFIQHVGWRRFNTLDDVSFQYFK